MTQPENFTAAQASDPATPGQVLADIAALRPDLRAAVASNPSAYPGLIDWLKSLGEPEVDAAIAAREAAPQPTEQMPAVPPTAPAATQVLPTAPTGAPVPPAPAWAQQPSFASAPPAGAPAPGMPQPGMPAPGMPPAGMPPGGYPPPGAGPQGGLQYGAPPAKSSNKALWIVLIILGVVALLSVGGYFIARALLDKASDEVDDVIDTITTTDPDVNGYGDDAELDALWDACEAEDWQACDDLYWDSPSGSEYEDFGDTCGNRQDADTGLNCVSVFEEGDTTGQADVYGDDPSLDALWDACDAEDWQACDDLYWASPSGSGYESFGDTCGERTTGSMPCVDELGDGTDSEDPQTRGDDPTLDALWDACAGGDNVACDDLFWQSPVDSEYEDFGWTCGGRKPEGGTCTE